MPSELPAQADSAPLQAAEKGTRGRFLGLEPSGANFLCHQTLKGSPLPQAAELCEVETYSVWGLRVQLSRLPSLDAKPYTQALKAHNCCRLPSWETSNPPWPAPRTSSSSSSSRS